MINVFSSRWMFENIIFYREKWHFLIKTSILGICVFDWGEKKAHVPHHKLITIKGTSVITSLAAGGYLKTNCHFSNEQWVVVFWVKIMTFCLEEFVPLCGEGMIPFLAIVTCEFIVAGVCEKTHFYTLRYLFHTVTSRMQ